MRKGNWADYGERMIAGSELGSYAEYELTIEGPHDDVNVPHWHARTVVSMRAQLIECACGFWLPRGRTCPACGR